MGARLVLYDPGLYAGTPSSVTVAVARSGGELVRMRFLALLIGLGRPFYFRIRWLLGLFPFAPTVRSPRGEARDERGTHSTSQNAQSFPWNEEGKARGERTYREIAIEEMLVTVQGAISQAIDWWGDLPPPMKEAIEEFRTKLNMAIDSVDFVKRALDKQAHETDLGKGPS